MSSTGLIETGKKWNRIEDKALTQIEEFIDSGSYDIGDSLKLCVAMVKESVKHQQVVLHEKIYEMAASRMNAGITIKKLKAS